MRNAKIKKFFKLKQTMDDLMNSDISEFGNPKSRTLQTWFIIINQRMGHFKFSNERELALAFRSFNMVRNFVEINFENNFRRNIFYRYAGGFKQNGCKKFFESEQK